MCARAASRARAAVENRRAGSGTTPERPADSALRAPASREAARLGLAGRPGPGCARFSGPAGKPASPALRAPPGCWAFSGDFWLSGLGPDWHCSKGCPGRRQTGSLAAKVRVWLRKALPVGQSLSLLCPSPPSLLAARTRAPRSDHCFE